VFDPPCPGSFMDQRRIDGTLTVVADPLFGGGELNVTGPNGKFSMTVGASGIAVRSARGIVVAAGDDDRINSAGGNVTISAGGGTSFHGGAGGSLSLKAGAANSHIEHGGRVGDGGRVDFEGGASHEGRGGDVHIAAGASSQVTGGSVTLVSGRGDEVASGSVTIATASVLGLLQHGRTGDVAVTSGGGSRASATGALRLGSGAAPGGAAGEVTLSVGASGSGAGAELRLAAGEALNSGKRGGGSGGDLALASGSTGWAEPSGRSGDIVLKVFGFGGPGRGGSQ